MARSLADQVDSELRDWMRAEPPAFLDTLVRERVADVLEQRRTVLAAQGQAPLLQQPVTAARPAPAGIGRVEAWAYACSFLAYGAQVADGLAQVIWRALSG